mmetsp:Transcript_1573/g.4777  ORF Transcript_1573/g.4777 Transcript_1573/m.4777 type:complete len:269 (-) Transcript_1573:239-1045(-)
MGDAGLPFHLLQAQRPRRRPQAPARHAAPLPGPRRSAGPPHLPRGHRPLAVEPGQGRRVRRPCRTRPVPPRAPSAHRRLRGGRRRARPLARRRLQRECPLRQPPGRRRLRRPAAQREDSAPAWAVAAERPLRGRARPRGQAARQRGGGGGGEGPVAACGRVAPAGLGGQRATARCAGRAAGRSRRSAGDLPSGARRMDAGSVGTLGGGGPGAAALHAGRRSRARGHHETGQRPRWHGVLQARQGEGGVMCGAVVRAGGRLRSSIVGVW